MKLRRKDSERTWPEISDVSLLQNVGTTEFCKELAMFASTARRYVFFVLVLLRYHKLQLLHSVIYRLFYRCK